MPDPDILGACANPPVPPDDHRDGLAAILASLVVARVAVVVGDDDDGEGA